MLRKSIISGLLTLLSVSAFAQQNAQYTQYMYNMVNVNPAYAGNRGVLSLFGLYRTQWVGVEGAPKSTMLSVHTPISDTKVGLGISLSNDRIGIIDESKISADVSYTLDLDDNHNKLSFGVKATANIMSVGYNKLNIIDSDPLFETNVSSQFSPNFGAGVYWHNKKTYVGFSIPDFLTSNRFDIDEIYSSMNVVNHYYLTAGHAFKLNPNLQLKPAVLIKATPGAPLQADLSANFLLKEKLTLGAAWRMDAAWSAMAAYQINDSFLIGYGFDSETTELFHHNNGSHELFIRYELFKRYEKINTPRFF